jgi:hypothetical protein
MGSAGAAFKFLNVDGHCYQSFVSAFEVDQGQLPTFVAFSPSKLRFATYRGAYTAVCILVVVLCVLYFDTAFRSQASGREFFDSVLTGGSKTIPMSQRPTVPSECEFSNDDSSAEVAHDSSEGRRFVAPTCYEISIHRIFVSDASDFLEEIRREEAERAAKLKKEVEEEAKRAKEEAKAAEKEAKNKDKKKSSKSKKGKKKGKSDEL